MKKKETNLTAIPGGSSTTNEAKKTVFSDDLLKAAWVFLYGTMYPGIEISENEAGFTQSLIQKAYADYETEQSAFEHFVQRVAVAAKLQKVAKMEALLPSQWIDYDFTTFSIAALQLDEIYFKRKAMPKYEYGLQLLAKAVYAYALNPTQETFYHYRDIMFQAGKTVALQQFYQFVVHNVYKLAA
jgi:hypothetical protein